MGPILGRQYPGRPHVGPMNFAIWVGKHTNRQTNSNDHIDGFVQERRDSSVLAME